jgi:Cu+-exporting ATPase
VVGAAQAKGISLIEIQAFESHPGKGISGKAADASVFFGNRALMQEKKIDVQNSGKDLDKLEGEGKTVMFLARNSRLIGLIAVRDTLKEFSKEAIDRLKAMGKEVIMLTGDNKRTALAIAKELGIDKVLAEVLPKDKVDEIKRLQGEGLKAAFVGDGINDAPALTQADLGIAIGSGSDVAIEAGDIILIKDDLRDVVMAMDLSRYAMKKIKQNLFFSFFYNSLGIPIAAGLLYPFSGFLLNPMLAGTTMAFSSVSVVSNSLLMRRYKRKI